MTTRTAAPLLFARDDDHDLNFGDELEDFDDSRRQPPRRGCLTFLILTILLAGGLWYVLTNPEIRSSVTNVVTTAIRAALDFYAEAPDPQVDDRVSLPLNSYPVPSFHEGQRVTVAPENSQFRFRLRTAAEGEPAGPLVHVGDILTVEDGRLIRKQWIYFVSTKSKDSGWIQEPALRPRS